MHSAMQRLIDGGVMHLCLKKAGLYCESYSMAQLGKAEVLEHC